MAFCRQRTVVSYEASQEFVCHVGGDGTVKIVKGRRLLEAGVAKLLTGLEEVGLHVVIVAARADADSVSVRLPLGEEEGVVERIDLVVDVARESDAALHETLLVSEDDDVVQRRMHVRGQEDPNVSRRRGHRHRVSGIHGCPSVVLRIGDLGGLEIGEVRTELGEVGRQLGVLERALLLKIGSDELVGLHGSTDDSMLRARGGKIGLEERAAVDERRTEIVGALGTTSSGRRANLEDEGDVYVELPVLTNLVLEGVP